MVTGPGFYYHPGENGTADPAFLWPDMEEGVLEVLLIEGTDNRGWALPGGHIDASDSALSKNKALVAIIAALRELGEETGVTDVSDLPREVILEDSPVGEWRLTAQAGPFTTVVAIEADSKTARAMQLVAKDDAKAAQWQVVGQMPVFASHENYIKLAIQRWQERTGLVVDKDGRIGRPERQVTSVDAANVLTRVLDEVKQQHKGSHWEKDKDGRENDYGPRFKFTIKTPNGEITLGIGTRDAKIHFGRRQGSEYGYMFPLFGGAVRNGLYVVDGSRIKSVIWRPQQIARFLESHHLNPRDVAQKVIAGLQARRYTFSDDLKEQAAKSGIAVSSQEVASPERSGTIAPTTESKSTIESSHEVVDSAFHNWENELTHPPIIKGVIGGYEDAAFLAGPTADKGIWRERFLGLLGEVAHKDSEYANLDGDGLLAKMREVTYNPVIVGRPWEASDAVNEAFNAANDWVLLLHFPDEPELSEAQENKGTGSIVERGAFYANIILRGNVLVAAITDRTFNLNDDIQRARAKSFEDIERRIPTQLRDRFIVTQTLEEAARVVWEKLKEFKNQPKERQEVTFKLDEEVESQESTNIINRVFFSGTSKPGTYQVRDAIKERLIQQGVPTGDANVGVGNWSPEIDRDVIWPGKQTARIEVITVEPDPNAGERITGLGALEDITDAFFRLSLGAYGQEESGQHQYKFILLPDTTEHPELLTGEFKRAYNIIMQHYNEAQRMPGFGHHIKIFTSREELEKYLEAAVEQFFPKTE